MVNGQTICVLKPSQTPEIDALVQSSSRRQVSLTLELYKLHRINQFSIVCVLDDQNLSWASLDRFATLV